MKLFTLFALCALLWAFPAHAILDPTPDLFGFYFDELADLNCQDGVVPFTQVTMYAIYTNPTVPEIVGFEFGMDVSGSALILQTNIPGYPFWDPIENVPYVVLLGQPRPLQPVNSLVVFTMLYIDVGVGPVHFMMRQADAPSGPWDVPGVILPGGEFFPVNVLNGQGNITAAINEDCIVPVQETTWSAVKAIYR
jgi:hypothetical protein|nr:hypothetical protein [Candidatus Krumholzibacteria bacterium]